MNKWRACLYYFYVRPKYIVNILYKRRIYAAAIVLSAATILIVSQHASKDGSQDLTNLVEELGKKLSRGPVPTITSGELKKSCTPVEIKDGGCGPDGCVDRTSLSESLKDRMDQLVSNPALHIQPQYETALAEMGRQLNGTYDLLILTAVSSNHIMEVYGVYGSIQDHFKTNLNYAVVMYDIGLRKQERKDVAEFCKCTVLKFPFEKFPDHISKLYCYGWKPLIIQAHAHQAEVVLWMDASIRISDNKVFHEVLDLAKQRGIQQMYHGVPIPQHTLAETFNYFGDEPCAYVKLPMAQASYGFYRNELFVKQAVLRPWAACSLVQMCICPVEDPYSVLIPSAEERPYATCHRFDQSVLSIILAKLFQGAVDQVYMDRNRHGVKIGDDHTHFLRAHSDARET